MNPLEDELDRYCAELMRLTLNPETPVQLWAGRVVQVAKEIRRLERRMAEGIEYPVLRRVVAR